MTSVNEIGDDIREVNRRQRGMSPIRCELAAGNAQRYAITGDYIHIHTSPGDDLRVSFDDGEAVPMSQGLGFRRYYSSLTFSSAAGQTIVALVGFGSVADARSTLTIQPGNALDSGQAETTIAAGDTEQIAGADTGRIYVLVKNPSTNTVSVWIGQTSMDDTNGVELEPGETLPVPTTSAVFARNRTGSGASATVSVLSVERV